MQFSEAVRNAMLGQIETTTGASPTLEMRTGPAPANCAAADTGTVLSTLALPADWMAAPAGGSVAKNGTWEDTDADAAGNAAHFRIKQGATCHIQGTVTATGGGGDIEVDNVSFAAGQSFTITSFEIDQGNA